MTLTADTLSDSISILGRYGFKTYEAANPDKVFVDVDLSALAGLEIDGSDQLKAKVDGTTIKINDSGQLAAIGGNMNLDDLSDVTAPSPATNDVLAWVSAAADWQNKAVSIIGTTADGTSKKAAVYSISSSPSQAAPNSHTHSGNTSKVANDTHVHSTPYGDTDGPSDTINVVTAISAPIQTVSAVTNISTTSVSDVIQYDHSHDAGTLGVNFA